MYVSPTDAERYALETYAEKAEKAAALEKQKEEEASKKGSKKRKGLR